MKTQTAVALPYRLYRTFSILIFFAFFTFLLFVFYIIPGIINLFSLRPDTTNWSDIRLIWPLVVGQILILSNICLLMPIFKSFDGLDCISVFDSFMWSIWIGLITAASLGLIGAVVGIFALGSFYESVGVFVLSFILVFNLAFIIVSAFYLFRGFQSRFG